MGVALLQGGGAEVGKKVDYIHYLEEAVYFFHRLGGHAENSGVRRFGFEDFKETGIRESIYRAVMRILVAGHMLDYDGTDFVMKKEHMEKHRDILDGMDGRHRQQEYEGLFRKAMGESEFFFDGISELEYEIYSRCNFPVTYEIGREIAKHINLAGKKALELGGSSGGLGAALWSEYKDCHYSVLDTAIPCRVGEELKESYGFRITFIAGNVFGLELPDDHYDVVIMMNLLHDFDDAQCLRILQNAAGYSDSDAKFLIIEDILMNEWEPEEAVMHGLRVAVECKGGKQRTVEEMETLFAGISYRTEEMVRLNDVHTMLVMGRRT